MFLVLPGPAEDAQAVEQEGVSRAGVERHGGGHDDVADRESDEAIGEGEEDRPAREEEAAESQRRAAAKAIGDGAGGHLEEHHRDPEHGLHQADLRE